MQSNNIVSHLSGPIYDSFVCSVSVVRSLSTDAPHWALWSPADDDVCVGQCTAINYCLRFNEQYAGTFIVISTISDQEFIWCSPNDK